MSIEIMKQALEALESCGESEDYDGDMHYYYNASKVDDAITALRLAIEQAERQEPVAWKHAAIRLGEELSSVGPDGYYDMSAEKWLDWAMNQQPRGKNSLPAPPQRQPLTDAEIDKIADEWIAGPEELISFARAIERAHGIGGEHD
jgi:hypothetical protein